MEEILEYLAVHGEGADAQIALATGIPLPDVRLQLSELAAKQIVLACRSIRFEQGKEIEVTICRLIGYMRPTKPGKKPKVQLNLAWANHELVQGR